jgi:hypothetical protein
MINVARFAASVFVIGCFSLALASPGSAEGLFGASARSLPNLGKAGPSVKRQKMVSINAGLLGRLAGTGSARVHTESIEVALFDGKSAKLTAASTTVNDDGTVVWTATAPGEGYAALSIAYGKVVGVIEADGRTYLIDPAGGNDHVLREVKVSLHKKDRHIDRPEVKGLLNSAPAVGRADARSGNTNIRLLAAYTADAKQLLTSGGATMAQAIDRDIAIVNQGMKSSGIPITIRRAGLKAVSTSYNENTADPVKPLYDVTSGSNANFPAIRKERNSVNADLVVLYIRQMPTEYCGVAWVNAPTPMAQFGFAVVDASCGGTVALAHELGHAMGLNHDRYVESNETQRVNYGFVSTSGDFRDIMSYPNKCYDQLSKDCDLKVYYSSPGKTINGKKAGRSKDQSDPADATRWLKQKRDIIAGFR